MGAMDISLVIILAFILLMAVGQMLSYQQENTAKKYFRDRGLRSLLVCQTNEQQIKYNRSVDQIKFPETSVISLETLRKQGNTYIARILESSVAKAGVMRYPCLLRLEDGKIIGKHFEE